MPVERKIQVEHEGKTLEFPAPKGFLHEDDIKESYTPKDQFQQELQRRIQSVTKGMVREEELVEDPEFFKRYTEKKKDDLRKALDIPANKDPVDVQKIQLEVMERVRRDEVKPLETGLKTATEEVGALRVRDLDAQVVQAGSTLRVVPDLQDLVKIFVRERAAWDPERRQWFIKRLDGAEGFELSADPAKGGYPYMTVKEFLEKDKRSGEHKNWYEAGTQEGADFRGGNGSDGRTMTVEQFTKLSSNEKTAFYRNHPAEFNALMAQIQRAGEDKLYNHGALPALSR